MYWSWPQTSPRARPEILERGARRARSAARHIGDGCTQRYMRKRGVQSGVGIEIICIKEITTPVMIIWAARAKTKIVGAKGLGRPNLGLIFEQC